jgi:hypothetical protein
MLSRHTFVDGCRFRGEVVEGCRAPHCAVQSILMRVTGDASVGNTKLCIKNLGSSFDRRAHKPLRSLHGEFDGGVGGIQPSVRAVSLDEAAPTKRTS